MEKNLTFGRWEGTSLLLISICTQIFLNMPRIAAETSGQAGWLLIAYISLIAAVLLAVVFALYKKFEGRDIIDVAQMTMGSTARVILGILCVVYFVFTTSIVLRQFSENVKTISLPQSPISYVSMFFALCMALGAYLGVEAIVRVAVITIPVIIFGFVTISLGVSKYFDVSKIAPWLGLGPNALFVRGLPRISFYTEGIILLLIPPFLKTNKNLRAVGYAGMTISAFFMTASTLVYLLVFQYPMATENFLPFYELARLIYYGRFFDRIESLFLIIWSITAFLYLSFSMFFIVYIFQKSMGLKYARPLVLPFSVLIFALSLLPEDLPTAIKLETDISRTYSFLLAFPVILGLLVAGNIILKKKRKKGAVKN